MSILRETWKRVRGHLRQAHEAAGAPKPDGFSEYLDHNELELAADVLADYGDEHDYLDEGFWQALCSAYQEMALQDRAKLCRFRVYESKHGFVEARLTLTPTADGGRKHPVFTDYRPDWNIGNRAESGEVEINGAPITVEDAPSISPGGTGLVRLHPLWRKAWTKVAPGAELAMHEGSRILGTAVVLRVTLRDGGHKVTAEPSESPWVKLLGWRNWRLRRQLVAECDRELAREHELHGRIDTALARCSGCDDVVFRLKGDAGFALVHLTWSGREESPPWPQAVSLPSFLALESAMDHHGH